MDEVLRVGWACRSFGRVTGVWRRVAGMWGRVDGVWMVGGDRRWPEGRGRTGEGRLPKALEETLRLGFGALSAGRRRWPELVTAGGKWPEVWVTCNPSYLPQRVVR